MKTDYTLFAEGGYNKITNVGGIAYIIIDETNGQEFKSDARFIQDTNSARVHLEALIFGLRELPWGASVNIVSDATYLIGVMSGKYKAKANLDLIDKARFGISTRSLQCTWEWRSLKLKDPIMKRVWRMCSEVAKLDFETMYGAKK